MNILNKTIKDLDQIDKLSKYKIKELCLTNDFSIIQLNDGAIGSSLNYANTYCFKIEYDPIAYQIFLKQYANNNDNLLLNYLGNSNKLQDTSVSNSIISALSQKFLNKQFLKKYKINFKKINDFEGINEIFKEKINEKTNVTIIGFEGLTKHFLKIPHIKNLYLVDYNFSPARGKFYNLAILSLKELLAEKENKAKVIIDEGKRLKEMIYNSDLLIISGSTLSNNTLENILSYAKNKWIVLQGPSCSILPFQLFNAGVTDVFTTQKDIAELKYVQSDKKKSNNIFDKNYVYITKGYV